MPPVETMTLVLPALTASRTSIHVISSIHTVSGGVSGFGVSTQLYGLVLQLPPPALRGSAGGRCPPRPCCAARAAVAVIASAAMSARFMAGEYMTLSPTSPLQRRPEAPDLVPVPAPLHIAPFAGAATRGVQEQPR